MKQYIEAEQRFGDVEIEKIIEKETDPHEKMQLQRMVDTTLSIDENLNAVLGMNIPEDAPADEIEKAKEAGKIINGKYVVDTMQLKCENDELFYYDPSKMLAGTEWVKISTDVEGVLDLITMKYKKIV